jgi:hypothetical protein
MRPKSSLAPELITEQAHVSSGPSAVRSADKEFRRMTKLLVRSTHPKLYSSFQGEIKCLKLNPLPMVTKFLATAWQNY